MNRICTLDIDELNARAARELRMDYSSVEYDGTTYLYRQ